MEHELNTKIQMVRKMLRNQNYQGVLVQSQVNLAWLTGGRFFVNIASEVGSGAIFIGPDTVQLIVNNIESERLWQEEGVASVCDRMSVFPWYDETEKDKLVQNLSRGLRVANDQQLASEFLQLRLRLSDDEQERYRSLGKLAGEVVESVAQTFLPGEKEYEIAARLAKESYARGMEPIVCLVGGDERAKLRRHPLPTNNQVQKYAVLVIGVRKWGLVASVTRSVYFGKLPQELIRKQNAVIQVDSAYLAASKPGNSLGNVFEAGQRAYAHVGFADEWRQHHQGGVAGYQSREIKAAPNLSIGIQAGHALAWNPTIQGTKSEDTVLVTNQGLEVLTLTGGFPVQTVRVDDEVFQRPVILER